MIIKNKYIYSIAKKGWKGWKPIHIEPGRVGKGLEKRLERLEKGLEAT